jgi:GT2 family glycosyltransferase
MPSAGNPTPQFLASIASLQLPQGCSAFDRHTVTGNFVPAQREMLVRHAFAAAADFLFMIDDDMVVPPDALALLAEALESARGAALVGALYYSRDGLRPMVADGWSSSDMTHSSIPPFDDRTPTTVDAVGFGCVLVRMSALRMLSAPFFGAQIYIETRAARARLCNEDYLLCERLRENGFGIILHPAVRCGHVDREHNRVVPERWERVEETSRRRMMVVEPGPRYSLVAFDATVPRATEHHMRASLDYVSVD